MYHSEQMNEKDGMEDVEDEGAETVASETNVHEAGAYGDDDVENSEWDAISAGVEKTERGNASDENDVEKSLTFSF